MPGAFRDDLEAARSRAEALREENEELREEVARLRAQEQTKTETATPPLTDRGPDSLTRRTLERLEHLVEERDGAPEPPAPAEAEPAEELPPLPRVAAPRALSPSHPHAALTNQSASASPVISPQETRLQTLERQLAEANAERDELRAGQQRRIRSFWVGIALGLALGVLLATVLR